jgi:hypothetical protein
LKISLLAYSQVTLRVALADHVSFSVWHGSKFWFDPFFPRTLHRIMPLSPGEHPVPHIPGWPVVTIGVSGWIAGGEEE